MALIVDNWTQSTLILQLSSAPAWEARVLRILNMMWRRASSPASLAGAHPEGHAVPISKFQACQRFGGLYFHTSVFAHGWP